MKSFNLLYKELGIKVYYTTSWIRIQKRYNLVEGIDFIVKDNDILLNDNVFEHIKNTYSKSKKLKEHTYLNKNQIQEQKENLNYIEEKIEDNKLKLKLKDLTKENSLLLNQIDKLNEFKNTFYSSLLEKNDLNRIRNYKSVEHREHDNIKTCLFITDVHYSYVIKPSHVFDYNEYNSKIAEERLHDCVDKFIDYYKNKQLYNVEEIIVGFLGDDINNFHRGVLNDKSIPEQIIGVSKLYIQILDKIKFNFPNTKLTIVFTHSNHNRINMDYEPSPQINCISNSYTYLIMNNIINAGYDILWDDCGSYLIEINGIRFLFDHGHFLKIGKNRYSGLQNAITKLNKQMGSIKRDYFDYLIIGHYHSPTIVENGIVCSSLVGIDSYSRSLNLPAYKPGITTFSISNSGDICNYRVITTDI